MLSDLKKLLECESVLSQPLDNAPFGVGCKNALDAFLSLADNYGLKTENLDGYCGYAECGEGEGLIGILCHLDVVPSGEGWSYPPYSLTVDNGYLYGRGVVDNKGPSIIALHILKNLKSSGYKLNNRIRVIVGCNEENGSRCMKYYRKHAELPKYNIVLDSDFPIINSEKGIAHLKVTLPDDGTFSDNLISLNCGVRPNVVPDLCEAHLKIGGKFGAKILSLASKFGQDNSIFSCPQLAAKIIEAGYKPQDFSANFFSDKIVLKSYGVAGHAMCPDKGENAFWKMISLFKALNDAIDAPILTCLKDYVCSPVALERLKLDVSDDKSGALTVNCGIAKMVKDKIVITLDFRLPLCIKLTEIENKILDKFPANTHIDELSFADNLFIDKRDPLIKQLLKVYTKVTNTEGYCVQSGGGTYARELPNSVAFGPTFPNTETFIHNADERISVVQFDKLYEIYYEAILALDKI